MLLLSELNKSNILVFSFEESLNEVTQTCKIDGYVGFWNKTELKVNVWFIGSTFLDHETYQNLLKHFHKVTKELDYSTLYQVSIVGASMNLKLYKEIVQDRQKNMVYSLLIEIGSWSLHIHIFNCNIETGAEKTGWKFKALCKILSQILHDTPARREDYESVTGSNKYLLIFCYIVNLYGFHWVFVVYVFVPDVNKANEDTGWVQDFIFFWFLIKIIRGQSESIISLHNPRGGKLLFRPSVRSSKLLRRCFKCWMWLDCEFMEFVASCWYTG